jgi:hypothetical protein
LSNPVKGDVEENATHPHAEYVDQDARVVQRARGSRIGKIRDVASFQASAPSKAIELFQFSNLPITCANCEDENPNGRAV